MLKPCDLTPPRAPTPSPRDRQLAGLGGLQGFWPEPSPSEEVCVAGIHNSSLGRGRGQPWHGARLDGWQVPPTPRFKVVFEQTQHPSCPPLQVLFGEKKTKLFKLHAENFSMKI